VPFFLHQPFTFDNQIFALVGQTQDKAGERLLAMKSMADCQYGVVAAVDLQALSTCLTTPPGFPRREFV
jgi:hypothetical protein